MTAANGEAIARRCEVWTRGRPEIERTIEERSPVD
jgi:hypothetical protein